MLYFYGRTISGNPCNSIPKRLTLHIQDIHLLTVYMCSLGIEPTAFWAANTMLYHWATGTPSIVFKVNCNTLTYINIYTFKWYKMYTFYIFLIIHPKKDQLVQRCPCSYSLAEKAGVHHVYICVILVQKCNVLFIKADICNTDKENKQFSASIYSAGPLCIQHILWTKPTNRLRKNQLHRSWFTPIYRRKDTADYLIKRSSE